MPGCRARPQRTRPATRTAPAPANPRYTGRQVWNRQRTDFDLADPANTSLERRQVQRWNLPEGWVISKQLAHAAFASHARLLRAGICPRSAPHHDLRAHRLPLALQSRNLLWAGLQHDTPDGRNVFLPSATMVA